jgi:hypothetical protein
MDRPLLLTLQLMLHLCLFTSQENRKTHPPKGINHCSDQLGHGHHPLFMHPWQGLVG